MVTCLGPPLFKLGAAVLVQNCFAVTEGYALLFGRLAEYRAVARKSLGYGFLICRFHLDDSTEFFAEQFRKVFVHCHSEY